MKKKVFSILFALVLVLSFGLVTAVPAAATISVNSDMSTAGINAVIASATSGDVVQFADGTYALTETLFVGVAGVTLEGNTANPESVVLDGSAVTKGIRIGANSVAIKGFTVENVVGHRGIDIYASVDDITIDSVIASGNAMGINVETGYTVHNLVLNNVVCTNNSQHGFRIGSGAEIYGLTITDSHFDGNDAGMTIYGSTDDVSISDSTFNDNIAKTGNSNTGGYGLYVGNSNGAPTANTNWVFDGCEFKDNHYDHADYTSGEATTNSVGILLCPYTEGSVITVITVSNSEFSGDQEFGIRNYGATIVDATNNWWGDASGPTHTSNTLGTGDPVTENVDFSPWLGDTFDITPMTFVHLVTGTDPILVTDIATVGISGSGAGAIGVTSGHPDPVPSITLFDGTGKTSVLSLDIYVTGYTSGMAHITVPYLDDTNDGIVDGTAVVETTLGLYYWDEATSMWRIAANNTVNTALNTVSGDIPVVALTGTPLGLGGYPQDEATVEIASITNLSFSGNDVVALTIDTQTAQLGAATIDITFDNTVVEVLGGENGAFDSLTVNPTVGPQTARFVANQLGATGVDATDVAVLAQVRLKAVGNTGSSSPLTLTIITLKDNDGIAIPVGSVTHGTATIGGLGDANSDGAVDVYDCVYTARAIAEIPGYSVNDATMDVDGSGRVDAFDCTCLARHIAGIVGYEQLGG